MAGRITGLLLGLALVAFAVLLARPELYMGHAPSFDLGVYRPYKLQVAGASGLLGVVVLIAAIVRAPTRPRARKRGGARPTALNLGADPEGDPAPPPPSAAPPEPAVAEIHAPESFPFATVSLPPDPKPEPEPAASPAWREVEPMPVRAAPPGPPEHTVAGLMAHGDALRAAGRTDDAFEAYDEAVLLARRAAMDAPSLAAKSELAGALIGLADLHDETRRLDAALPLYEEALGLRRTLAQAAPGDAAVQRGLSIALERLADAREARGHRMRALGLYQESLPIAERLAAEHPGEATHAADLAATRARLAELEARLA